MNHIHKNREITKGYQVTQSVDISKLLIPKNIGTAAITLPSDYEMPSNEDGEKA